MSFKVEKEDSRTDARLGSLETAHGAVETPVFMDVGTLGTVSVIITLKIVKIYHQNTESSLFPDTLSRQIKRPLLKTAVI